MSVAVGVAVVIAAIAGGVASGHRLALRGRLPAREQPPAARRILLLFVGPAVLGRAFEETVRLAKCEDATIVAAFLVRVPRQLPLDSPLLAQPSDGVPLTDAIKRRAAAESVPVESRTARGRTYRDALRRLLAQERFERVLVSAGDRGRPGLSGRDLEWLFERVPAEVLIVRPAPDELERVAAAGSAGYFEVGGAGDEHSTARTEPRTLVAAA